ncbi:MAG: hypothetical protein U0L71_05595 [Eggerthellaceae bacterium]|nr:hypothetical protein [Eggerthellaceae bacterium]
MIDETALDAIKRCVDGGTIGAAEALRLMEFDSLSPEAALARWAAEAIGRKASGNKGQIYAQIGVDEGPCPVNCAFCSLAACNSPREEGFETPIGRIVEYAQTFDRAGVHLITLMSTAAMPFARYLEIVQTVREAISPDMPLMANTRDFSMEQAFLLKKAGVQAVYHADRLGEGVITSLDPSRREETIAHAREAGMALMTAVEPVSQATAYRDIIDAMSRVIAQRPYCSGVGVLTAIHRDPLVGQAWQNARENELVPISRARGAQLAAIMRLMAGESIPFGTGSGNVVWVDAGSNPRGRDLPIDGHALARDVSHRRKELLGREWEVPKRPLQSWFD